MYEKLESCPSCGHTQFNNFMICRDTVSEESFALVKCSACQLVFLNPRPIDSRIEKYQFSNYPKHIIGSKIIAQNLSLSNNLLIETINKYSSQPNTILWVNDKHPEPKITTSFDQVTHVTPEEFEKSTSKEKYTDIYLGRFFFQTYHLQKVVRKTRKKLFPGGRIYLPTRSYQSFEAIHYRELWSGFDIPRQFYFFNRTSINKLLKVSKLHLIDDVHDPYQAFICAAQSNIQTGKFSILNTFRIARKSNKLAAMKKSEYTGHIYVIGK